MASAIIAGHICLDLFPALPSQAATIRPGELLDVGPLEIAPGGCVGGTGTALASLGTDTALVANIGDDLAGELLEPLLASSGASVGDLSRVSTQSTSYSIVVEPSGSDRSFWHHVGANATFDGTGVDTSGAALLHLGYPSLLPGLLADEGGRWRDLLERASKDGLVTSMDLATFDDNGRVDDVYWPSLLERSLPLTDVVTPSIDDLVSALSISAPATRHEIVSLAEKLVDLGAAVVMLTAGADGLYLVTNSTDRLDRSGKILAENADAWANRRLWIPALCDPGDVVTTTGAGDASAAGLLHAIGRGDGPEIALLTAARTATNRILGRPVDQSATHQRSVAAPDGWNRLADGVVAMPGDAESPQQET